MYREARYARLYDGPDEVHKMTVARHVLRDPFNNVPGASPRARRGWDREGAGRE